MEQQGEQAESSLIGKETPNEASQVMDFHYDEDVPIGTQDPDMMQQETTLGNTNPFSGNDGFTLVNRKSKRQRLSDSTDEQQDQKHYNQQTNSNDKPSHQPPNNTHTPTKLPAFLILGEENPETYFDTAYELTRKLETEKPHLKIRAESAGGKTILIPMDQQTYEELDNNPMIDGQPVPIQKIDPQSTTRKLILQGYPLNFSMRAVLAHAQVAEATRCNINGTPTKQVLITLRGPIPTHLDLKTWGTYSLRPYTPEPLRCYNCQRFGHHQSRCARPPTCGVCSGRHNSQQCIDKLKAKQPITTKCPNCSGKHHAWNKFCPARKSKIQLDIDREEKWVQERLVITPAPQKSTFNWWTRRDNHATPQTPVNLTTNEFPPLPPPASQKQQPPPPHRQINSQGNQTTTAPTLTQTTAPATASIGTQTNQDMTTQTNMETTNQSHILVNRDTMIFLAKELSATIASFLSLQIGREIHTDGIQACAETVVTKIVDAIQNPEVPKNKQTPQKIQSFQPTQPRRSHSKSPKGKSTTYKKTKTEHSQEERESRPRSRKHMINDTEIATLSNHTTNRDPRLNRPDAYPTCPYSQQTQRSASSSGIY